MYDYGTSLHLLADSQVTSVSEEASNPPERTSNSLKHDINGTSFIFFGAIRNWNRIHNTAFKSRTNGTV